MNTNIILTFLFSNLTAIFASFLTQLLVQKYNVFEIIFLNALIFIIFSIPYQIFKNKQAVFDKKDIKANIIIGILFFISLSFWYYGLKYSSLVEAVTLKFLTPIFIMLFSFLIMRKKIEYQNWIIIVFALIGAITVIYYNNNNVFGVYCVLLSVIFSTLFHLCSRKFPTQNVLSRSIIIRLVSLIFSIIICINNKDIVIIDKHYILILILMMLISSIYFLISNKLNTNKNIISLQPLNLIRILFAIIIQYAFLQQISNIYTILGILLIAFTIIMISVFKEYEKQLLEKNKELEILNTEKNNTFIQIVHDLKTPISIIKLSNEILTKKFNNNTQDKEIIKFCNFINNNSQNLEDGINNILKLKQLENIKNVNIIKNKTNIEKLLKDNIENIMILADEKNIKIQLTNLSEETCFIIDEVKLKIIVKNMLSNAIKFAKSIIDIEFKISDNKLELLFKNDGPLINNDIKYKVNNGQNIENILVENSTGFGFIIINKMVNLLNGYMEIKNEDKNEFKFIFNNINS